ncbi:MAG: efflux RND transporter periplasmic adaptor subunit [Planctomycetota bacterium]
MIKWLLALIVILGSTAGGAVLLIMQAGQEPTPPTGEQTSDSGVPASDESGSSKRGGGFSFSFGSKPEGEIVRVATPEAGDLYRTVSAPGSIEPKRLVEISSQVSARIEALPFREGQTVPAGDVVVRLDPQNLTAALASAEASLLRARAQLDGAKADLANSRLEFQRVQALFETGDETEAVLQQAEATFNRNDSNVRAIEADIAIAEANIEQRQEDLGNTVIESPMTGIITALNAEEGETAIVGTTNTPGSVIMEIADLSEMLVIAQVDETNIAPIRENQRANIYINAYPDEVFRGTVQRIGLKRQQTAAGTGFFEVEILLDLEEGTVLRSGLTASVEIEVEPFFDVLKLPTQAVVDRRVDELPLRVRGSELVDSTSTFSPVVYLFQNGKSVVAPVKIGPSDLTHTVVLEGLEPDAKVVVGPYRVLVDIRDGRPLRDEAILEAQRLEREAKRRGETPEPAEAAEESADESAAESAAEPAEGESDD